MLVGMTDTITDADRRLAEQRQRHDRILSNAPDNLRRASLDTLDTSELIVGDEQVIRDAVDRRLDVGGLGVQVARYIELASYDRLRMCLLREADGDQVIAQAKAAFVALRPAVASEDVVDESDRDFGVGYRDVARLIQFADLVRARAAR